MSNTKSSSKTVFNTVRQSASYQLAKAEVLKSLKAQLSTISGVRGPIDAEASASFEALVREAGEVRGRDLFFPWITSGAGNGPFVELADGSIKYDLITGIGVNFFGHGNLDLFEAEFDSLWGSVMQGNLSPNHDYTELMKSLLRLSGPKSRLKHAWLATCGATVNEIALKIIRQKKYPATRIFAFNGCFAGRTTALSEITDNPAYRQGQPIYGEVTYLPFYNPHSKASAADQAACVVAQMQSEMKRYPDKYAMLEFEIVQGEGGFNVAPREFLLPIVKAAKEAGLYVWDDEVQTFGRSGEVFCYQRLGLDEYIDVVTAAKLLQTGAVLWTSELNPKPGLVSGTFAGSSGGIRAGIKVLELLETQLCGPRGRIRQLEALTISEFERIKSGPAGRHLVDYTVFGGMVAFTIFDGSLDKTKKYLKRLWDAGVAGFYAGHGPYRVRLLPPFGVLSDEQWKAAMSIMEQQLIEPI